MLSTDICPKAKERINKPLKTKMLKALFHPVLLFSEKYCVLKGSQGTSVCPSGKNNV
jgi:hypothetical protein